MNTSKQPAWKRWAVYISFGFLFLIIMAAIVGSPSTQEGKKSAVELQFSPWSGAHIETERAIKRKLNDPDSYKHFETRYWVRKDGSIKVVTDIGARNGFGGMVRQSFESIVSPAGTVVSITPLS